jgi:hypothetical protein
MIDIIIKYRGKYYKAKKNIPFFTDKCEKCPLKLTCQNGDSIKIMPIHYACSIYDAGFRLVKNTEEGK